MTMSILCGTLLGLALALPRMQDPAQLKPPDFAAEYKALEKEFQEAQNAFYEPYQKAKTDEEREKIQLDESQEPTQLFVPRFQDLARRAQGTDSGARSLLWIVSNAREMSSKSANAAVDELVGGYRDSNLLSQLCTHFQYGAGTIGIPRAEEVLDRLGKESPHADVRASALFARGVLTLKDENGSKEEAKAFFQRVKKEYSETPWAQRAESYLFEAEHLQIGMVAPDFQVVDESGKAFKLSDYRGKVVVLDFWGFW
jgi:hypothetical protein